METLTALHDQYNSYPFANVSCFIKSKEYYTKHLASQIFEARLEATLSTLILYT